MIHDTTFYRRVLIGRIFELPLEADDRDEIIKLVTEYGDACAKEATWEAESKLRELSRELQGKAL